MSCPKRIYHKLKIIYILNFIEKQIIFTFINNFLLNIFIKSICICQLMILIIFKIYVNDMRILDTIFLYFSNNLTQNSRFTATSDAGNNLYQLRIIKRAQTLQILCSDNHNPAPFRFVSTFSFIIF